MGVNLSPSTLSSRGRGLDKDLGGVLVKDLNRDLNGYLGRFWAGHYLHPLHQGES